MKRKKVLIALALFIVLLSVLSFLFWHGRKIPAEVLKVFSEKADVVVRDFRLDQVDESTVRWTITADTARYTMREKRVTLEKVRVRMSDAGKVYDMSADRGEVDTEKRDMDLFGNVVLTSDRGDRCETAELHYRQEERRLFTPVDFLIEYHRMEIRGEGLALWLGEKRFEIAAAVRARISGLSLPPSGE